MSFLGSVDWGRTLRPDTPIAEIVVRGSIMYLALYTLLRLVLKRQAGSVGIADLLVLVLIADAAQNGMAGTYTSVADGVLLVATIIFWAHAVDWLGYRFAIIGRFVHPPPLPLIVDGKMLRRNMRQELITPDELMTQLREQGVGDVADVQRAYMEGDGRISIVHRAPQQTSGSPRARRVV